jgi:hypothetical protein
MTCLLVCMFAAWGDMPFVRREGMHFLAGDQRFYYLGASCYYLPYWASDTSTNAATGRTYREEADAYLEKGVSRERKGVRKERERCQ